MLYVAFIIINKPHKKSVFIERKKTLRLTAWHPLKKSVFIEKAFSSIIVLLHPSKHLAFFFLQIHHRIKQWGMAFQISTHLWCPQPCIAWLEIYNQKLCKKRNFNRNIKYTKLWLNPHRTWCVDKNLIIGKIRKP